MSTSTHVPSRAADDTSPRYLAALVRSWSLLLLAAMVAGGGALALSTSVLPKTWTSTASVLVDPAPPSDEPAARTLFLDDQSVGRTFEELAKQPAVVAAVAESLGTSQGAAERHLSVHAVPKTPLLELTYTASTPDEAARGARTYTDVFLRVVQRGQWLKAEARLVSPATVPLDPAGPRVLLNTVIASLAGLLVALGLVCLVEQVRSGRPASPAVAEQAPRTEAAATEGGTVGRWNGRGTGAGSDEMRVLPGGSSRRESS